MSKIPIRIELTQGRDGHVNVHASFHPKLRLRVKSEDILEGTLQVANDFASKHLSEVRNEVTRIELKIKELAEAMRAGIETKETFPIFKALRSSIDKLQAFSSDYEIEHLEFGEKLKKANSPEKH